MTDGWFDALYGASQHVLDVLANALALAYAWAKEWQILLAGLLVFLAAIIVARAILKASAASSSPAVTRRKPGKPDLRQTAKPDRTTAQAAPQEASQELVGNLEQLRSLIRSALSSLTLTAEKENSPTFFLCQRITHLRLEQIPPGADKAPREAHVKLLQQLEALRALLKKNAPATAIAEILVQLNTSARNLVAALTPAPDQRREVNSDLR